MPRRQDSPQRQDPPDADEMAPAQGGEAAPDAWLDNPRNIQAFFEAIERARKAKSQERP